MTGEEIRVDGVARWPGLSVSDNGPERLERNAAEISVEVTDVDAP